MANKKYATKRGAPKKKKSLLSQTPAAIAKRKEREKKAIPGVKHKGRKPGSKNKPKAVPFVEASFSILSIIPSKEKVKRILDIIDSLKKEETNVLQIYPKMTDAEKLKALDRLSHIIKELGVMTLYKEMLTSDSKPKKESNV